MKVAIQGELGSFSHEAAERMLQKCTVVPCARSAEVFDRLEQASVGAAVIPIENTLHGSVHENYDHLLKYDLPIRGETFLRIVHNIIVPPGVKFSQIRRVYSHPVALNQCRRFFEENPQIERTPFYDTAGSVKMVMEEGLIDAGAIASANAAEIYGAKILRRSIEDDRENFTRFFLLERPGRGARRVVLQASPPRTAKRFKTTLVFTTRNLPGALFRSLSAFALRDISLTKIESRPLRGKPWEYLFYLDFMGHVNDPVCRNALNHLAGLADMLRILGCYPAGE